jgi:putative redox protein
MIAATYVGGDRLRIDVRGHQLSADQPAEDGGGDTAPTPTELFLAGLTACVGFYAERFLRRHNLSTVGLSVGCTYGWAEHPHRVGVIELIVAAPGITAAKREAFAHVIEHCTVHNTLDHPPDVRIKVATGSEPEPRTKVALGIDLDFSHGTRESPAVAVSFGPSDDLRR